MAELKEQAQAEQSRREQPRELVFALDIGTRSIVGIVGKAVGDRLQVLDVETAEHGKRAMLDGQIDDIGRVAELARQVTARLEERLDIHLRRVCVAAAGRALRTQSATFFTELQGEQMIDAETISRVETGAVAAAEEALQAEGEGKGRLFLVGYTIAQYRLDNYPLVNLLGHSGKRVEADVVATFLPSEVVESLYAAMHEAGLQVASMTLEPIAAMNAAIPAGLRLLNLALVDIGAGTTDIALCRDGSVTGYTMATVAGDEITEAIMRALLVDFQTAEQLKRGLSEGSGELRYRNILGFEETVERDKLLDIVDAPTDELVEEICKQIVAVNGEAPSAIFLAGGGSKLSGLTEKVAARLEMDAKRVAIAGNNFAMSAFSETLELDNPEYATPLGIAVSAGLGLLSDSYVVMLNGQPAKLFRNGMLTLRDLLMMNGYGCADLLGKSGRPLLITLNGKHVKLHGAPALPAVLRINGTEGTLSALVHAGDQIQFIPARSGKDASQTVRELLGEGFTGRVRINDREATLDTPLANGDIIVTETAAQEAEPQNVAPIVQLVPNTDDIRPPHSRKRLRLVRQTNNTQALRGEHRADTRQNLHPLPSPAKEAASGNEEIHLGGVCDTKPLHVTLNNAALTLEEKESGMPYYLMDLLEYSGLDFDHLDSAVSLVVNGVERGFQYELKENDTVTICCTGQR